MMYFRHYRRTVISAIALVALLACRSATGDKERVVLQMLAERAPHLGGSDRARIAAALLQGERTSGIDALLLMSVMEEESAYRIRAKSRQGAIGLMQVRPATARDVAERNGIEWAGEDALYDPRRNVRIGAAYLAELKASMKSWDVALTAYHRGPTAARRLHRRAPDRRPASLYAATTNLR
jgi:soluble lytic murein transglycosylase-like protein